MNHPIMSLQGGNAWALGEDGNGGVRETTELGKRRGSPTFMPYRTKDGIWLHLLGLEMRRHLPLLCKALGVPESAIFPHGMKGVKVANQPAAPEGSKEDSASGDSGEAPEEVMKGAVRIVDALIGARDFAEWKKLFAEHDVWYVRVNKFEDMADPSSDAYIQNKASGMLVSVPGVRHELHGTPVLLSKDKAVPQRGAPIYGA